MPKFEEWERHIFHWLLFLVGNDNSRKILAFLREWVALTFKGESQHYEDKDKVSKPSSQELAKEIVALALKQSVHENEPLVTEQSITTSTTENFKLRSQSEPSRSFNKQDVDGTQSENDFYSDIEIEDFSQREKLVARKLVNLFKVCQRHDETKTMLEFFVDIYLRHTQFKDLSNNYPWNDFWKLIERLAGFNFEILKAQLMIVVETVNQYNELNDLIVLWSKYIKKVVHFHDYSSQTIADGQILVNKTRICIDKYFPGSVAIIRTEILKLLDGLLNNQAISRHIRATGKMKKCFRSPRFSSLTSGLRLEKEIITEIINCVFRKMTKQIGHLSIMGSSMSKKLKIGDFKIPLNEIWPEFVQVESDQQFRVKLDHIPIMDKRVVVALMFNGLKPAISKVPIHFKNAFFEFDDFIDIDVNYC